MRRGESFEAYEFARVRKDRGEAERQALRALFEGLWSIVIAPYRRGYVVFAGDEFHVAPDGDTTCGSGENRTNRSNRAKYSASPSIVA